MNFEKAICGRSQLTSLAFIILVYEFTHEQILTKYKTDSSVKAMVDKMDWVIMPVLNVDGYEYTFNRVSMCSRWMMHLSFIIKDRIPLKYNKPVLADMRSFFFDQLPNIMR